MTNEEAQKEYEAILEWVLNEENKRTKELIQKGLYSGGLDGNASEYAYIYEERNKRIRDLYKRWKGEEPPFL